MSGFTPSPDPTPKPPPPIGGITSQQTTYTPILKLGSGMFKEVIFAQYADDHRVEFSYEGLARAGGPDSNDYYAIVSVADFPAGRLLSELQLQFHFSEVELLKLPDGTTFTLSPKIFALRIQNKGGEFRECYGKNDILGALASSASSLDGDEFDFLIAMERVNYEMTDGFAKTPSEVINAHHNKLIHLINAVLEQGVILSDIKLQNLFVKCSELDNHSCQLGVIDLDKKFVADVTGWRFLSIITGSIHKTLARQYMVLMVCYVGLNNKLEASTRAKLLESVGLAVLSQTGEIVTFNVNALDKMLEHDDLKKQIKHYLGFNHDRTPDIAQGFNDEYIKGELSRALVRDSSKSASSTSDSFGGGKARRKHKKTRKRKPKSKKTRRKRSLLNRVKAWDR